MLKTYSLAPGNHYVFGPPVPLYSDDSLAPGTQVTLPMNPQAKGTVVAIDPGEEEGQFDRVTVMWAIDPIQPNVYSGSISSGLSYDLVGPTRPLLINDVSGSYSP